MSRPVVWQVVTFEYPEGSPFPRLYGVHGVFASEGSAQAARERCNRAYREMGQEDAYYADVREYRVHP